MIYIYPQIILSYQLSLSGVTQGSPDQPAAFKHMHLIKLAACLYCTKYYVSYCKAVQTPLKKLNTYEHCQTPPKLPD